MIFLRKLILPILILRILLITAFNACTSRQAQQPEASPSMGRESAASTSQQNKNLREQATPEAATQDGFDFYLLALSWAPQFCASHEENRSSSECDPAKRFGFIVHGFWPQNDDGTYPTSCTRAQPVNNDLVRQTLPIMPASGLIQHEWATHGTCSGLTPREYFSLIQRAFAGLKIPDEYQHPAQAVQASPKEIEQKFAVANGASADSFRVACGRGELIGVDVCFTKELQYRSCGTGVRECRARELEVLPLP